MREPPERMEVLLFVERCFEGGKGAAGRTADEWMGAFWGEHLAEGSTTNGGRGCRVGEGH